MLQYSPTQQKYPGDDKFRISTQVPKRKRRRSGTASVPTNEAVQPISLRGSGTVGRDQLDDAKLRLCGFINDLMFHEKSLEQLPNRGQKVCVCCGKAAFTRCMRCPGQPALHINKPKGRTNSCFLHYHNTASFGLWRADYKYTGQRRDTSTWTYPDQQQLDEHGRRMERLHNSVTSVSSAAANQSNSSNNIL
jgi:hypothetical protein